MTKHLIQKSIDDIENLALTGDHVFLAILHPNSVVRLWMWSSNKTQFIHNVFKDKFLLNTIVHINQMQWVILYRYMCME